MACVLGLESPRDNNDPAAPAAPAGFVAVPGLGLEAAAGALGRGVGSGLGESSHV